MKYCFLILTSVLFFSCEKKELPAKKYDRGNIITMQVSMESNYKNQIWYRLIDNKIISTNLKTDWDIAFENSLNGSHIILNGANAVKVYKTNFTQLSQVTDTTGIAANGQADMPSGNLDSTAFGNWQTSNTVYIINRGYNEMGQLLGFYKMKMVSHTTTNYIFEYADIFGTQTFQANVNKDGDYNFNAFSFIANAQVNIEPKKTDYDLCFTQYTYLFHEPLQYYQVTGILNNRYNTRIAKISHKSFSEITLSDTATTFFNNNRDVIGYDWKTFNLNNNLFTVDVKKCYIINDSKGFYYKLHFIDFYNSSGVKGFPKFEFIKL
ncbi:MAG: HmuY family protein [Bacteroidia bacterium]|nr:HmuY family protein [Bacteroidia bacterium]